MLLSSLAPTSLYSVCFGAHRFDIFDGGAVEVLVWEGQGSYGSLGMGRIEGGRLLGTGAAVAPLVATFEAYLELTTTASPCPRCHGAAPHHLNGRGPGGARMVCRGCALVQPKESRCGGAAACRRAPAVYLRGVLPTGGLERTIACGAA